MALTRSGDRRRHALHLAHLASGIGLLLVLASVLLRLQTFAGLTVRAEGEPFRGTPADYIGGLEGPRMDGRPDAAFTPSRIEVDFAPDGTVSGVRAQLTDVDGVPGAQAVIASGAPLELDEATVSIGRFGIAPMLSVRRVGSGQPPGRLGIRLDVWAQGHPVDRFQLPAGLGAFEARFFPDLDPASAKPRTRTMAMANPALQVRRDEGGGRFSRAQLLTPGQSVTFGDVELGLSEIRTWAEFGVRQRHPDLATAGGLMLGLGLLLELLLGMGAWRRRRREQPQASTEATPAHPAPASAARTLWLLRGLVFLGAFLLFAVQPLVGSLLLPETGGAQHVWSTSLMFFQGMLFLGYLYCHALSRRLGPWHLLVAAAGLAFMPIAVNVGPVAATPVPAVLLALTASVAVPFGVLATTSVLAQRWLAASDLPGRDDPYTLYVASNVGSLAALVAYPLLVSPLLGLRAQAVAFTAGYVLYLLGLAALYRLLHSPDRALGPPTTASPATAPEAPAPPPSPSTTLAWLALAAAPSALLLATTDLIARDFGALPMVWMPPLALYLLTFVLGFRARPLGARLLNRHWVEITVVAVILAGLPELGLRWKASAVYLAALFAASLASHHALYRARPAARHLTRFYLAIALGGWLGAAFVTLAAPRLFDTVAELPLALAAIAVALLAVRRRSLASWLRETSKPLLAVSAAFFVFVGAQVTAPSFGAAAGTLVERYRNDYGIYTVVDGGPAGQRLLRHGTTRHGSQSQRPEHRTWPTSYYHRASPLGDVLSAVPSPRRVGIVGLGAGTTAAYFGPGEAVTFFELDPDVERLAREHFTFLADCQADVRVVHGDARVSLAAGAAPDGAYHVLIVDAFAGDAVPLHLGTREALELYFRKLAPGGLLAFHISNRHHDLREPLTATAHAAGLVAAAKDRMTDLAQYESASRWLLIARSPQDLAPFIAQRGWQRSELPATSTVRPWTDDHADLLESLL